MKCYYVIILLSITPITLNNITWTESKLYSFTLWNNKNVYVYCIT